MTAVFRVLASWLAAAGALAAEAPRIIETPHYILRLAAGSGDLVGLQAKPSGLEVIAEPALGENFRILVPRPGYEANYFYSREQTARIETSPDGVILFYDRLRNSRETLPLAVRCRIGEREGQLQFSIEIENQTARPLAEVYYAVIGGQRGLGERLETESLVPGLNSNLAPALFHNFRAGSYGGGNLGIRYDAAAFTYPGAMTMGWAEFSNPKRGIGLYYGNHDPDTRLGALYFELRPFTRSAVPRDNWPPAADLPPGEPVGLTMGWLHCPYTAQGVFQAGPTVLAVHEGDWHEGSRLYRAWFDRHFAVKREATWLRKEHAWQSVIISNGEDEIVHPFRDLPRLAADAKKYDVTTFEILGWDLGGIDRGYPQYTPDPRLGTAEEFRNALAQIRKLGVHPLIFSNIQVADTATPVFREKLARFAIHGRWADDWPVMGWGEGTISARMGLARSNMTLVSAAHPEYREFLMKQYLDLIRDGAEGLQLDKTNALGMLDFNPRLPVSPDRSLIGGVLETFRELLERGRKINPRFALASEIFTDRSFPYVDVSYVRMNEIDMNSPALRYTFPEWTSTIFAESPGDRNIMNNGMRYGLVWALAPRHYNDSLDEPLTRPLARYVSELIRIRRKHADVLFHGRFRDTEGASVSGGPEVRFSVFEASGGPGRACVVVNYSDDPREVEVDLPGGGDAALHIPFEPDRKVRLPARISLPPRTCAVVAR